LVYEQVLNADPKNMDAVRGLAALALERSDFDQALEYHGRLIDLGERSSEVLYNAGLLLQKAGQMEDAARLYREAAEENPDFAEAMLNLGHVLKALGQEEEARSCWSKALEAKPELAQGYFEPAPN
jgi:tetratricopeptide (TPR) repeat protein